MSDTGKKWLGKRVCDLCGRHITGVLYDARTTQGPRTTQGSWATQGPWATLCQQHFDEVGVGLGTGRGQRYVERADGEFYKDAG